MKTPASPALEVYFWDYLQVVLPYEQITLNESCMLVVQHRQNSTLSPAVRMVILICFRSLERIRLEDDEVFASDMTDIGLQFHAPDATSIPFMFLPVVLQRFAIIESRAE